MENQDKDDEIAQLKQVITMYETVLEFSKKELAEARDTIKGFEAMLNLSSLERKQSYETLDAFRLVQEVSRQELIGADKILQSILMFDRELVAFSDIKPLMTKVLLTAMQALQAEFGIIFLKKETGLVPVYFENITEEKILILNYIESLVKDCIDTSEGRVKAEYRVKLGHAESQISYICSHFKQEDKTVGAIYLEKTANAGYFHEADLNTLEVFSLQVSISMQQSNTNSKMISMLKDINDKNRTLQTMQDSVLKLSQAKDAFLANISHEIRTPLSIIYGFSELLQDKDLERTEIDEYSKGIYEEVEKLNDFLGDLLLITNLDTEHKLEKEFFELDNVIQECLFQLNPFILEKKIEIVKIIAGKVFADRALFTKAILNIIKNAICYNNLNGRVEIISEHKNKEISISIKDTGIGISESDLIHVFDKFFRVDTSDTYEVSGIGIGLFIAKRLIEIHGGSVTVNSELTKGSIFRIHIPLTG